MQIKPNSARTKSERDAEQLENLQNTLIASIAKKRRALATSHGDEATALTANIANLERMLDGALEMSAAAAPTDEQSDETPDFTSLNEALHPRRYAHVAAPKLDVTPDPATDEQSDGDALDLTALNAHRQNVKYGYAAK